MSIASRNLKRIRNEKGLSQQELGKRIGCTSQTISRYENGIYKLSAPTIEKLSKALGVSPISLMGWDNTNDIEDCVPLPNLGTVAGGIPIDAIEDRTEKFAITNALNRTGIYCTFDIKGNSMMPYINDGDTVLVRYQPTVNSGDVAIIYMYDYSVTCKKVFFLDNGKIKIQAYNEDAFATKIYTRSELADMNFRVLGKVILVVRDTF